MNEWLTNSQRVDMQLRRKKVYVCFEKKKIQKYVLHVNLKEIERGKYTSSKSELCDAKIVINLPIFGMQ